MLILLIALACHKDIVQEDFQQDPDCKISSYLMDVYQHKVPVKADNRVQVVIVLEKGVNNISIPSYFHQEEQAGNMIQGWLSVSMLCELSNLKGIRLIREPTNPTTK